MQPLLQPEEPRADQNPTGAPNSLSCLCTPQRLEVERSTEATQEVFRSFLEDAIKNSSLLSTSQVAVPVLSDSAKHEAQILSGQIGEFLTTLTEPITYWYDGITSPSADLWCSERREVAWQSLRGRMEEEVKKGREPCSSNGYLIPDSLRSEFVQKVCDLAYATVAAVDCAGLQVRGFELAFSLVPAEMRPLTPHPVWHNHFKVLDTAGFFHRVDTTSLDITTALTLHGPCSVIGDPRDPSVLDQIPDFTDLRKQYVTQRPGLATNLLTQAAQLYDLEATGLLTTWSPPAHHPVLFGRLAPHRAPNGVDPKLFTIEDRATAIQAIARQLEEHRFPPRSLMTMTVIAARPRD